VINFVGGLFFRIKNFAYIATTMDKIRTIFKYGVKGIFLVLAFITLLLLIPSYVAAFYVAGYKWAKRGIDQYLLAVNSGQEKDEEILRKFNG